MDIVNIFVILILPLLLKPLPGNDAAIDDTCILTIERTVSFPLHFSIHFFKFPIIFRRNLFHIEFNFDQLHKYLRNYLNFFSLRRRSRIKFKRIIRNPSVIQTRYLQFSTLIEQYDCDPPIHLLINYYYYSFQILSNS